jgi:uncharacterized protein (DUF2141 family)
MTTEMILSAAKERIFVYRFLLLIFILHIMKFHIVFFVIISFCTSFCAAFSQTTGTITVIMRGMSSDAGVMRVALFSEHNSFPSDKPDFGTSSLIYNAESTVEFHNVPFGQYAVSVFHDKNANAKLDIGLFGPVERYGFSNGARGILGPPSFDKAKAAFYESHKTYIVEVK